MTDMIQRVAMKAVIVKDGKVLLLREAKTYKDGTNIGRFHMPGGRLDVGEAFEDGLRREVREETGMEIEIVQPIYVGEWRPVIRDVPHQIIAVFFVCTPTTDEVKLSEEHDKFMWVDPQTFRASAEVMDPEDKVLEAYVRLMLH